MSQVPNAANAIVDDHKITDYLLNSSHSKEAAGKSKFFEAFGFLPSKWDELKRALVEHPLANPVIKQITHSFGIKYMVSCSVKTPDGRNPCIISIWTIEPPVSEPKFVTAYPNSRGVRP
jgi:hypothetical protein